MISDLCDLSSLWFWLSSFPDKISRMKTTSDRSLYALAAVLLLMGALWIWLSRDTTGASTAGQIPAPRQGFMAPDFSLSNADGETVRLSDLRGKAVLVNVWASWCGPCRSEMPAMQRLYQDYQGRGFELLAVNSTVQDSPTNALAFARELGLEFPILFDTQGEVTDLYQVRALPSSFFIDPQGMIQEVVVGGPMSEALLRIRVDQLLEKQNQEAP